MGSTAILVHDNLDDRREIWHLLAKLTPARRVAFLHDACRRATLPNATQRPGVQAKTWELARRAERDSSADERLTFDVYFDLWHLSTQYTFDLDAALNRLVEMVRRPAPASPCSSSSRR